MRERDETVDGVLPALEDRLDASVRRIPHPAGDTRGECPAASGLAEEDPLDVALDDNTPTLHLS